MSQADSGWINGALANWKTAERELLDLDPVPVPTVVTADERCQYDGRGGKLPLKWAGRPHGGKIQLPDGGEVPVAVMSFASATKAGEPFFVMTLPSIWRAGGVTSPLGLEALMDGVLLHEIMHTRQIEKAGSQLVALEKALGSDINDDALQEKFSGNPAYVAAWTAENDRLYQALLEPDQVAAKQQFREGLAMMSERRRKFLSGSNAAWADADRLFLAMEGMGQWLIYRWDNRAMPHATPTAATLEPVRRTRKWWTQDEGLALFLLLDRFLPDWRGDQTASDPMRLDALLAAAAR
ncbi:hypothetical protein FMM02_00030 [Sphingomonas xanthus]|uniref:Uncharacterized protein n=2 Tax=Sphingomonas xanthus TaxID=2594473 RepID=A0A516INY3_9SPHN|nr:hypothetical protein FMM02_00030 [Sphingomonas xanthus]